MVTHRPRKRFGQNFLESEVVIRRLVASIAPQAGDRMVEIGPGLGALTRPLLEKLQHLDVVELDRDLAGSLQQRLNHPSGLVVHQADALKFDYRALLEKADQATGLRVVGNLPYNISTPLLFYLLDQAEAIQDMHFMLQKEVVDRLTSEPNSKNYGRLSVMAQFRANCERLFSVPPDAFRPPPKVDSAIVRIVPKVLSKQTSTLRSALERVVRQAFSQRRKTLRNSLHTLIDEQQFERSGIDSARRAETLSLEEFLALARISISPD